MAKGKVVKSGTMTPVRGGPTGKVGKQGHAGPAAPWYTGGTTTGSGGKWAKGGPSGKVGKSTKSSPVVKGRVSVGKGSAVGK